MRPVLSCVIGSTTRTRARTLNRTLAASCAQISPTNVPSCITYIYRFKHAIVYTSCIRLSLSLSLTHTHTHTQRHTHTHVNQIIHHPYLRHACVRTGSGVTVAGNDRFRCILVITSGLLCQILARISQHKPSIRQHTSEYL
jgi:hypothetical protein